MPTRYHNTTAHRLDIFGTAGAIEPIPEYILHQYPAGPALHVPPLCPLAHSASPARCLAVCCPRLFCCVPPLLLVLRWILISSNRWQRAWPFWRSSVGHVCRRGSSVAGYRPLRGPRRVTCVFASERLFPVGIVCVYNFVYHLPYCRSRDNRERFHFGGNRRVFQ